VFFLFLDLNFNDSMDAADYAWEGKCFGG